MIRKMVSCLVPKGRPSASLTPIQGLNSQDEVVDPPKVQLLEEQLEEVTKLTEVQGMEQSHTDATDPTFTSTATFSLDLDSVKPLKNDIEKSTRAILVACQMLHLNGELTEAQVKIVDFITTCCQQIHAMMEGLMDGCDAAATAAEIRKSVNALKMADHMLQASSITQAQAGTVSLITSCVTRIGPDAAALTEHLSDRCGRTAPARPAKPKPQTDPEAQSVGSADPILFPPGIVPTQSFQAEQSFQASLPSPRPDPSAQSRAALQE